MGVSKIPQIGKHTTSKENQQEKMLFFLLLAVIIFLFFVYNAKNEKPKNFPAGPRSFPIIGSLLSVGVDLKSAFQKWRCQWGDIVGGSSGGSREDPALKKAGCICTSPNLKFDTTDAALKKKSPQIFGRYQFAGTEGGRPFYQKTPASTPPTFLFWMPAEKQWVVGPTKGNKSGGIYSSTKNSLAVCPGDPPSSENWQRKSSFLGRWKNEATLSMTCDSSP